MTTYTLFDNGNAVSMHPNREGARLSSLFHVGKGETVLWSDAPRDTPASVATDYGTWERKRRFHIAQY
jgi:hypothetical protein